MNGGGVYLNVGSAVVLPEVFLKCVTLVRNLEPLALGHHNGKLSDFIQSYRPLTKNVVRRPTENGAGKGFRSPVTTSSQFHCSPQCSSHQNDA
jgi:hypothetical protein